MPYPNEKARRLGHVPVVNSKSVQNSLERWIISTAIIDSSSEIKQACIAVDNLPGTDRSDQVLYGITVDGSDTEVEATRDHPTIKIEYLRVAASFVDFSKLKDAGKGEFVDPRKLRESYQHAAFDGALPGSGLVQPGLTGVQTWRKELNNFFATTHFDEESPESLLDMLFEISGKPGNPITELSLSKCPSCLSNSSPIKIPKAGTVCPNCNESLYPTDVLRTAEEYSVEGSNQSPLTRTMLVAERLTSLGIMKTLYLNQRSTEVLGKTLFITDGPLALFGVVAPLHRKIHNYIQEMQNNLNSINNFPAPLIVGVEKSDRFVEHSEIISNSLKNGHVMPLSQKYINKITGRPEGHKYGVDEFYGRRFIYKTSSGNTIVFTIPPAPGIKPYGEEASEDINSYPTLKTICKVLDKIQTRLYPNAVIPVALAHNAASIPLGIGQSVLRAFSQEKLGLERTSRTHQKGPFAR